MKTITFYSYKGGVGRSLALSQVATRLSEYGKKVCVLDFDLEAPGLHFKFHNYDKQAPIKKGIVDYIADFNSTGKVPSSLDDYLTLLNPKNQTHKQIILIPAGDIESEDYWLNLAQINWSSLFYDEHSLGVKFFLDLKARIKHELNPDFLLIDSRTGITDIAGITLRLLADEAVILAANNAENIFGSKRIIKSLIDPKRALFGTSPKIHFVLTRLPFTDEPHERAQESNRVSRVKTELTNYLGIEKLDVSIIHSDRRLEKNETHLMGYEMEEKGVSISNDYLNLFETLSSDVLTDKEKQEFHNKRLAEEEYQKAIRISDLGKRIQHLNQAIQYEPNQSEFYFQRAYALADLGNRDEEAIRDYEKSLELTPNEPVALNNLSLLQKDNKLSEKLLRQAIAADPSYIRAYTNLAHLYDRQGNFAKALEVASQAIDLEGESKSLSQLLNLRANLLRVQGDYDQAMKDTYRAIEHDSNEATYFGTLAEIYFDKGMPEEFYMNLTVALAKGIKESQMHSASDVYQKLVNEPKFIELIRKYGLSIEKIIKD